MQASSKATGAVNDPSNRIASRSPLQQAVTGSDPLVEGHGVEGDAHAGAFVRHRYLARRQPHLPNLRQIHLIPSERSRPSL